MKAVDPNVQGGLPTPAAVYLLQRRDGLRFKIGWALEPVLRVQRLPEFSADELDLVGSHAVWLPTVSRAQQFERALHRGLATYRVLPSHTQDGHTEWFLPTAHPRRFASFGRCLSARTPSCRLPSWPSWTNPRTVRLSRRDIAPARS